MTGDGPRAARHDPRSVTVLSTTGFDDNQTSERLRPKTKSNNQPMQIRRFSFCFRLSRLKQRGCEPSLAAGVDILSVRWYLSLCALVSPIQSETW